MKAEATSKFLTNLFPSVPSFRMAKNNPEASLLIVAADLTTISLPAIALISHEFIIPSLVLFVISRIITAVITTKVLK